MSWADQKYPYTVPTSIQCEDYLIRYERTYISATSGIPSPENITLTSSEGEVIPFDSMKELDRFCKMMNLQPSIGKIAIRLVSE